MTISSSASNIHMSSGWGARLGDRSGSGVGGCAGRPARWLRHPSFPARAHLQLRTPPRPISGAGRASSARASRRFSGNLRAVALTHRQRFILAYGTSPAIPSSWVRQMGRSGRLRLSSKVPFTCASSASTSRRNIGRAKWHGTTISRICPTKQIRFESLFPRNFRPSRQRHVWPLRGPGSAAIMGCRKEARRPQPNNKLQAKRMETLIVLFLMFLIIREANKR